MGVTIIVNKISVAHKGSNGTSIAFPDVCKTPSPGGPIPIPYPNIAKSSDTNNGSKTVKMDGQPIMLKGSNFMMSTGDEAGSLLGVVSNKIKGKAEFVNYSFNVKVEGKNVCRLLDPMQQNMGSGNGFCPAEIQANLLVRSPQYKACEETKKKVEKHADSPQTRWGKSGIIERHRQPIQDVVNEEELIIYFRRTKKENKPWIEDNHEPKPHSILKGTTITSEKLPDVEWWLENRARKIRARHNIKRSSEYYNPDPDMYIGIVMSTVDNNKGQPLRARKKKYRNKWITGDYDLFEILKVGDECETLNENDFSYIKAELNVRMEWDGIQHGPQAQWTTSDFSMPEEVKNNLERRDNHTSKVTVDPDREPMPVIDNEITIVAANNIQIYLENVKDVKNALICCGCKEG